MSILSKKVRIPRIKLSSLKLKSLFAFKSSDEQISGSQARPIIKILDFIIFGSILLVFFLTPLFFTGLTAQAAGFEKMLLFFFLALIGVVAWVTEGVLSGELEIKRTPLDLPLLVFVGLYAISSFFSVDKIGSLIGSEGNSTKGLIAVIVFVLFYYLVVNNINLKRFKLLFWSLVVSSSLIIVYSLFQLLGIFILPIKATHFINFNPVGSSSGLAMFLGVVLPILVVAATQLKELAPGLGKKLLLVAKVLISLIILINLSLLVLLAGFVFWPAVVLGIVVVLMFFLSKIVQVKRKNLIIPLVVFFLLIIFLVLGNMNLVDLGLPAEVSLSRKASWGIAKNSLMADPILGSGPATFYYSFSKHKGNDFNYSELWNIRFNNASGALFEFSSTIGSLGTLALLVVILIALSTCFLALTKISSREASSVILALFASLVVAIIYSLLFFLNNTIILVSVLLFILALASSFYYSQESLKSFKLSFRASPKYALSLAAVFLGAIAGVAILFTMGIKIYLSDVYVKQASATGEVNEKITKLEKAVFLFPYRDNYYTWLASGYMNIANQGVAGGNDQSAIAQDLSKAIDAGKRAVELSPNKASNNEALALVYENASFYVRGALDWSEKYYEDLARLEPENPVPDIRIALINITRANAEEDEEERNFYSEEAIKGFDQALAKKGDLAVAYYGKSKVMQILGRDDEAIAEAEKAVNAESGNIDYRFELGRLYFNKGIAELDLPQADTDDLLGREEDEDELSIEPGQNVGQVVERNNYISVAEQFFLSVLQLNPNHANTLYGLALLYQKVGEDDNASIAVKRLISIVDEGTAQNVRSQFPGFY